MEETNKTKKSELLLIDPRNIIVKEGFNSRQDFDLDELVISITDNGVLNPVTVVVAPDNSDLDENGKPRERYQLVDGERRYRATMIAIRNGADISRIPAIKIPRLCDFDLLVQQVVRNDGKPFNEYEYGIVVQKFLQMGKTKTEISRILGKNAGCISYYVQHLERDPRIQELLKDGKISGAEVRRIYSANKGNEQKAIEEINNGKKKAEEDGEEKITLKRLNADGKTLSVKRSEIIKKGLRYLLESYMKYSNNGEINFELDLLDVKKELDKGNTIDNIFKECADKERLTVKEPV